MSNNNGIIGKKVKFHNSSDHNIIGEIVAIGFERKNTDFFVLVLCVVTNTLVNYRYDRLEIVTEPPKEPF